MSDEVVMTAHNAKFTDALLPVAVEMLNEVLPDGGNLLDPFAGTGKGVDFLCACGFNAWGLELEAEWAAMSPHVFEGDALDLPWKDGQFDAIFTSPTYGNRMADKDMRPSVAGTYAKSLGRHATEGSSCHLQWGEKYRAFHVAAWTECRRVLVPGGFFLLNVKDHFRGKKLQRVPEWHVQTLVELGFEPVEYRTVETPGNRRGQNAELRVDHEHLVLLRDAFGA